MSHVATLPGLGLIGGASDALTRRLRGSLLRRRTARGPLPDHLSYRPAVFGTGAPELADRMFHGLYVFDGVGARADDGDPWRLPPPSDEWYEALHGFGWLTHFRAADGREARRFVRGLAAGWLKRYGDWHARAWRPAITGDRVTAWTMSGRMLIENAEMVYRSDLLRSLAAQARYLDRAAESEKSPRGALRAAFGLAYAGLCLPGHDDLLPGALSRMERLASEVILPDGGPVSRNPGDLLDLAERFAQLRVDLRGAEQEVPDWLDGLLERAAPMLRLFRQVDGGLALFHGARECAGARVDRVIGACATHLRPAPLARDAGYHRLAGGRTAVIMDAGQTDPRADRARLHASSLAIEAGVGRQRMIVNCGSGAHIGPDWALACRATAAHSTLCLGDASSSAFERKGILRRRAGSRLAAVPAVFESERKNEMRGAWALANHDGYVGRFGMLHYRRLFLNPDGSDLRGEDTLLTADGAQAALERALRVERDPRGIPFSVRFHMHPDLEVDLSPDETSARILFPNDDEWVMRQSGGVLALEESVYLGRPGAPRPTTQIVVRGTVNSESAQVKWAFRRANATPVSPRDFEPRGLVDDALIDPDETIEIPNPPESLHARG